MLLSQWGFFISFCISIECSLFWSCTAFWHGICYILLCLMFYMQKMLSLVQNFLGIETVSYLSSISSRSDQYVISIQWIFKKINQFLYVPCLTEYPASRGFGFPGYDVCDRVRTQAHFVWQSSSVQLPVFLSLSGWKERSRWSCGKITFYLHHANIL